MVLCGDYKSKLWQLAAQRGLTVVDSYSSSNPTAHTCVLVVRSLSSPAPPLAQGEGNGMSKKEACQCAARVALEELEKLAIEEPTRVQVPTALVTLRNSAVGDDYPKAFAVQIQNGDDAAHHIKPRSNETLQEWLARKRTRACEQLPRNLLPHIALVRPPAVREGQGFHVLAKLNQIPVVPSLNFIVSCFMLKPTAQVAVAVVTVVAGDKTETFVSPAMATSSQAGRAAAQLAIPFVAGLPSQGNSFISQAGDLLL